MMPWKKAAVYEWHKPFREGSRNVERCPSHCVLEQKPVGKVMLEVFFYYESDIQFAFIPECQTVIKEFYVLS